MSVEVEVKRKTTTVKSRSKRAKMKGYFLCVMRSIFFFLVNAYYFRSILRSVYYVMRNL